MNSRYRPWIAALSVCLAVLVPTLASAQSYTIDLGPEGDFGSHLVAFATGLGGTPLDGRTMVIDIEFADDKFLEITGQAPYEFFLQLDFQSTNTVTAVPPANFSGFYSDRAGNQIDGTVDNVGAGPGIFGYFVAFGDNDGPVEVHGAHFEVTLPTVANESLQGTLRFAVRSEGIDQVSVKSLEVIDLTATLDLGPNGTQPFLRVRVPATDGFQGAPINGQIVEMDVSFQGNQFVSVSDPNGVVDAETQIRFAVTGTHSSGVAPPGGFTGSVVTRDGSTVAGTFFNVSAGSNLFAYWLNYPTDVLEFEFVSIQMRAYLPVIPGETIVFADIEIAPAVGQEVTVDFSVTTEPSSWGQVKADFDE